MQGLGLSLWLAAVTLAAEPGVALPPFTVKDARSLPTPSLARELLGERLGSRVIQVERHEYEGSSGAIPSFVELFTQPEVPSPVINGICRTDVITIEYDWPDQEAANDSTSLNIMRVAAKSRYKSFQEPAGDPGSEVYERAHKVECARMSVATDAFRAPSAGDAQWLAAIHKEYSDPSSRFAFTCTELPGRTCADARTALSGLALNSANKVSLSNCPKRRTGDQVDYCYRLEFNYPDDGRCPDIGDCSDLSSPEWIVTVFAGMRDGMAPVRIRSLHIEHVPQTIGVP